RDERHRSVPGLLEADPRSRAVSGGRTDLPDRGQRVVARSHDLSGAAGRAVPSVEPSRARRGVAAGPCQLAQPDRALLLDRPAEGAQALRMLLPRGDGRASETVHRGAQSPPSSVSLVVHQTRPRRTDEAMARTFTYSYLKTDI